MGKLAAALDSISASCEQTEKAEQDQQSGFHRLADYEYANATLSIHPRRVGEIVAREEAWQRRGDRDSALRRLRRWEGCNQPKKPS